MKTPPILLLGMHRSGTTMLVEVLEELGVFVGYRLDENREPKLFTKLNDWALRQANASWDDPWKYRTLSAFHRANILRVLRASLRGPRRLEYLGPGKFIRYRSLENLDFPWAWKDPRNTFTVDLWRDIFPAAKIVHIHRHPLDVAQSLRQRELRQEEAFRHSFELWLAELTLARRPLYGGSARLHDLREGVKLWEEYLARVTELKTEFNVDICDIRYEDFVAEPAVTLDRITEFLELEPTLKQRGKAVARVAAGRSYAFLSSPELVKLYREVRESKVLRQWHYDDSR